MYCSKCGAYAPDGSAYCMRCGEKLAPAPGRPARSAGRAKCVAIVVLLLTVAICACVALALRSGSAGGERHEMREWFGTDFVQFRINSAFSENNPALLDGRRFSAGGGADSLVGFEGVIVNYGNRALRLENLGVTLTFDGDAAPEDCPFVYAYDTAATGGGARVDGLVRGSSARIYVYAAREKGTRLRSIRLSFAGNFEEGPLNRKGAGPGESALPKPERVEGAARYEYRVDCE